MDVQWEDKRQSVVSSDRAHINEESCGCIKCIKCIKYIYYIGTSISWKCIMHITPLPLVALIRDPSQGDTPQHLCNIWGELRKSLTKIPGLAVVEWLRLGYRSRMLKFSITHTSGELILVFSVGKAGPFLMQVSQLGEWRDEPRDIGVST